MNTKVAFGQALKKFRNLRGLSQEDFSLISSRTYISTLERGIKNPTLEKVDAISKNLEVHPLTLLFATYLERDPKISEKELFEKVKTELNLIVSASNLNLPS